MLHQMVAEQFLSEIVEVKTHTMYPVTSVSLTPGSRAHSLQSGRECMKMTFATGSVSKKTCDVTVNQGATGSSVGGLLYSKSKKKRGKGGQKRKKVSSKRAAKKAKPASSGPYASASASMLGRKENLQQVNFNDYKYQYSAGQTSNHASQGSVQYSSSSLASALARPPALHQLPTPGSGFGSGVYLGSGRQKPPPSSNRTGPVSTSRPRVKLTENQPIIASPSYIVVDDELEDDFESEPEEEEASLLDSDQEMELVHLLVEVRKAIVRADPTLRPSYVISNQSINAVANILPHNLEAFSGVEGVGKVRAKRHGEKFLSCIRQFCTQHGIELTADDKQMATPIKAAYPVFHNSPAMKVDT